MRPVAWLRSHLRAEADRWFLFVPIALALGIILYFSQSVMPAGWLALPVFLFMLASGAIAWRLGERRPLRMLALSGLAFMSLGYLAAALRLAMVEAPVLGRAGTYGLLGTIVELQPTANGARLLLADVAIDGLAPAATPALVRVAVRMATPIATGDRVHLLARLQRPQGPALPGGFDYARQAYFQRIGALGFAFGKVDLVGHTGSVPLAQTANPLRQRIAERIISFWPGPTGQMSAALLTGLDAGIDQATWSDMQRSGLAHLISISGLHMAIVAGTMFLVLRYGLALIPPLALRFPVKKLAAIGAMLAVTGYLLISDGSVPAVRSWLMVLVSFTAVLLDRNPFSLRLLAFAAIVVLLYRPESLLGASFQLSFAAVLALMSAYEAGAARLTQNRREDPPFWQGPILYVAAAIVSTVIATAATTPLAAYHFQNITTFGALANLLAIPLSTFVTMPAGMLGLALMPLGLDRPAFLLMNASVWVILKIAHLAASLPGSAFLVVQAPILALVLFGIGMVWLCLWRGRWRAFGLPLLLGSFVLILRAQAPDMLVQPYFDMAAVRDPDGSLRLLSRQSNSIIRSSWLRAMGQQAANAFPLPFTGAERDLSCDASGCLLARHGRRLALSFDAGAVAEDCAQADLVIASVGAERCEKGGARLLGPRALRSSEGVAVWWTGSDLVLEKVSDDRGRWPWTWHPGQGHETDQTADAPVAALPDATSGPNPGAE